MDGVHQVQTHTPQDQWWRRSLTKVLQCCKQPAPWSTSLSQYGRLPAFIGCKRTLTVRFVRFANVTRLVTQRSSPIPGYPVVCLPLQGRCGTLEQAEAVACNALKD